MFRLIIVPLVATLVIAAMLLVLDKMLRLFDFVAREGGPVNVVWQMLANLVPEYLSLAIPVGLLLGILLAFRKLALSSELDVFKACGIGYRRLLFVPYIFTVGFVLLNLLIVSYFQPIARYSYENLQFELRSGALGASINVGEFNNLGSNMTLRVEESTNDGRDLSDIFVRTTSPEGRELSVSADHGTFMATDEEDTILLRLTNGRLIHNQADFESPRVLSFESHDLPIDLPRIEQFRGRGGEHRELTLFELVRVGGDESVPEDLRLASRANFHYRLAEIAMMFLLPLLAVALAVPPKRSTSALGVFLSVVMITTYHKICQYGEDLAALGRVDPLISLWVPFVVFAGLIIWMYYHIAYVPGGQPIGALEKGFSKIAGGVRKLFLRRQRPIGN
ncbi:LPS export ABC transporter permease LptF [Parasphingopyxis sp.]|uniref:LPS export ABC transporter permease LptF n=1 Tax=Parasphingopyxis sp. TaxID=1920299 RepID=UPI002626B694|nr:LPS export ABC transporter permease LptF [Parasphingopyxis sp.]